MNNLLSETIENYNNHVNSTTINFLKKFGLDILPKEAKGATVTDTNGKVYIDCIGGYGILNIGYNHPDFIDTIITQLKTGNLVNRPFLNQYLAELSKQLAQLTPGNLTYSFICNSGSEAIDSAIKLARLCTGKSEIVAAEGSFHGYTLGALSVSGIDSFKKYFQPLIPDIVFVSYGNVDAISAAITQKTAAVILEPVQHEAGVKIPSFEYFQKVRQICSEKDVLLILDEIKTGFGKTGKFFACEHFNIVPDILVLGKSMAGGLIPIGAIVAPKSLWLKFSLNFPMSASSFAGNQLACCCALSTIKIIKKEKLIENCHEIGNYLLSSLRSLQEQYPAVIQEATGIGLLIGVKIINPELASKIVRFMISNGVLVMPAFGDSSVIMIEPPLCLSKNQADKALSVFKTSLDALI